MKSILSFTIFFTFLIKMGGYFTYLSIEREIVRERIERQIIHHLPTSDLVRIVANPANIAEIKWERQNKEFKFKGDLYDIVSVEIKDGVKHYICIRDKEETALAAKIDALLDQESQHLPFDANAKHFLSLLLEPLTIQASPSFVFGFFFDKYPFSFPEVFLLFTSNITSILKPPPQL
jgi:hypothetical protein